MKPVYLDFVVRAERTCLALDFRGTDGRTGSGDMIKNVESNGEGGRPQKVDFLVNN